VDLQLLHGPYAVAAGVRRPIPRGAERLVVLVALDGPIRRCDAAHRLWPLAESGRAAGNLRSALWRLHSAHLELVRECEGWLRIDDGVDVDLRLLERWAASLDGGHAAGAELDLLPLVDEALNLLPGCYDDWVSEERDRLRALVLDALDVLSDALCRAGRWANAIDVSLLAVTTDPLRESSQAALIRAHLAEGNVGEARGAYEVYRARLKADIDLAPPTGLSALVAMDGV
jgi:DNA-binding SARP family transcriptional activator